MRKDRGDDAYEPEMPGTDAEYLVGMLFEIGPTMAAGMGPGPITHGEIRAWQENIGLALQPWEARFLRRLSLEYIAESHRAEKRDCPAPWRSDGETIVSAATEDMRQHIRRLQAL